MTVPLSLSNLRTPPTADEWNTEMLALGEIVGLPTTDWQQGSPERTIFAIDANVMAESDVAGSIIAQAGFLDFAAQGTVVYTDATGTVQTIYVTPDPSIPAQNPTAAIGWLDVHALNQFNVRRILRTFAGGTLALLNTSASTYGPFAAGTYHVAQAATGATYSNAASITVPPSVQAGANISAATNATPIAVTATAHGLTTGATVLIAGALGNTAANGAWIVTVTGVNAFTLNGSVGNGSWTSGGKVYVPISGAFTADAAGSASSASSTNVVQQSVTSLIGVSVSNVVPWLGSDTESNIALAARCRLKLSSIASTGGPKGAYTYYALSSQALGPTLLPPVTVSAVITRALVTLDYTTGTVTTTIANAAGVVGGSDVTAVAAVIQAFTVLFAARSVVQSAAAHAVATVATIYLPAAYNTATNAALAATAVNTYFAGLAIAGVSDPAGPQNVVPIEGVRGAIERTFAAASIPIQDMTMTLNGVAANVQLVLTPVPEVAIPSAPSVVLVSA